MRTELYIGLMSGTSIDGMDGVLAGIDEDLRLKTECAASLDWDADTRKMLHELCGEHSDSDNVDAAWLAANAVARHSARMVRLLLEKSGRKAEDIAAIGSHGQTVRHRPQSGFSVQLDNGPLLAALTDIDAVVNFRAADLSHGGQGAPLTQAFHKCALSDPEITRFVLNLGGIANMSVLAPLRSGENNLVTAYDTGPANTLMDLTCRQYADTAYDVSGALARSGKVMTEDLERLLAHPYLSLRPPKSTGREDFNRDSIGFMLDRLDRTSGAERDGLLRDTLATLTEFTARSVTDALARELQEHGDLFAGSEKELVLCGGGGLNDFLKERLERLCAPHAIRVRPCTDFGIDPKYMEAQAFALFAAMCARGLTLPLSGTTGAKTDAVAGCICPAVNGRYRRRICRA